jgi:predicted MPP superfamily phosphohydrolase
LKKNFLIISLLLIVALVPGIKVNAATTDVMYVTTSIGEDASREMLINYHAKVDGTLVEYTVATDSGYANKQTVTPASTNWSYSNNTGLKPFEARFVCKASLTNLNPDTGYRYRIKTPGNAYSNEYFFKTALGRGTSTFLFITDSQATVNEYVSYNTLIAKAKELRPDTSFIVHTGDITDRAGNPDQWNGFYNNGTNLTTMPIASTTGNHEYYTTDSGSYNNPDIYNQFFNNPQNGPESRKNSSYYFTYNNILFVMLDTVSNDTITEQQNWFKEVVSSHMNRIIIVGMHIGAFTGGGITVYADGSKNIYRQWAPIFETFNVDLVLSGHEHNYAPSKMLYQGKVSTNGLGTSYLVGPASGTKTGGYNIDYAFTSTLTLGEAFADDQIGNPMLNLNRAGVIVKAGGNETEVSLFNEYGIAHTYKIAARRPSSVYEVGKDEFMDSFEIVHDEANNNAKLAWGDGAYGNVKTIKVTNGTVVNTLYISSPLFTEQNLGQVFEGNVYPVNVEVVFNDDTTKTKDLELDLSGEDLPPDDDDPTTPAQPVSCNYGTNIVTIFGLLSSLAAFAFVLKKRH